MKKILLVLASLLVLKTADSQVLDSSKWMQYMLESPPNYYKVKNAFYGYWGDSVPVRSYGYKAFKRWEWRALEYLQQDGTVAWPTGPLDDLVTSGGPSKGNVQYGVSGGGGSQGVAACPQGGRWSPVGPIRHPYNQSGQPTGIGRINGIAFHPTDSNTLFVCAPQGGVWKTTNNGQTWAQIFGKGPVINTIGATSMVLSYNNPDTMYVGTGDRDAGDAPGYGVIASWNGGKTWVARNSGMGNVHVGRMIMHPQNSAIIIASTSGGVYRTTNGGSSWTQTLSGGSYDVAFKPNDPSVVYAVIGASFYRSTNGGVNWTLITSGLPTSGIQRAMIAVTANDANYVYMVISNTSSGFYGLYQSTDAGQNFSTMSTTPNILGYSETGAGSGGQAWYDLDIAADPHNKSTIYVFGINVWKSTNGGANWTINGHWVGSSADDIHADQHSGEFNITGRKLYAGNDGGIYYTINGGSRWNNVSTGIQNSQIYRLAQAQSYAYLTAQGYQDNGSAISQQDEFYTYYGGDGMDCAVDPGDHTYVYGSYVYGRIYRAINKNTIITLGANGTNGINEGGGWLTPFVLQEGNPSRMFAGYVNIWRCDNVKTTGTPTWSRISTGFSGNVRQLESSPADNKKLYAINGSGQLVRTDDATVTTPTWTNLSGTQPSGLRHVQAHHKRSATVYAVNSNTLYRSTNSGASWTTIQSIPSSYGSANCIAIDTSSTKELLYVGTDKGIVVWDSANTTLAEFNTGFPIWADVTDLELYYSPLGKKESHIVASTYGMGVWKSNLYEDGTQIPDANFYAFDSVFVVGGKMRLYEKIANGAATVRWRITPYSYTYVDGTDSTSLNPIIQFNQAARYSVRLIASNCQGSDTFSKNYWIRVFKQIVPATCKNTTTFWTNNYGIGNFRVQFSDNMSETGGYFDDDEYLDLSQRKVFRVKPSTTYSIKVKTGLYNNENVRIFIDYNNNGKFENFNNEVIANSAGFGERTISVTTPSVMRENTPIRMRILSDFNSIDTNACRNLGYGQGEDYSLVNEVTTPLFKVSKTNACTFEQLTFTDTSKGLIGLYEWNFGAGASPATAVGPGPHTVSYSTTGLKNVRLRINGLDSLRKNSYVTITTGPSPLIKLKSGSLSGCPGGTVVLAARATNGVPFTVQWQKDGVNLAGKTDTLLTLTNISTADAGAYRAILVNGSCSATSAATTLVVNPKPSPNFTVNNSLQCQRYHNFTYTNTSSISSGTISSLQWKLGDGTVSSSSPVSKKYSATGNYTVKLILTSNLGCIDSISKTVSLFVSGNPKFTINDSDQCLSGNSFQFTNSSTISSGSLTYQWQFGDGNTSTTTSPTKSYASAGMYTVRLISTSNNGCLDTALKSLRVYSKPSVSFTLNATALCFKGHNFTTTNSSSNVDGALSYLWKFGDGNTSTTTTPTKKYSSYGNYALRLIATSSFGCKDSQTTNVSVYPQASLKFTVNDSDQCLSGNSYVFTNNSTVPSGTLSYTWDFGDASSSSSTSPTKSYASRGIYTVKLYSNTNNNCKDTASKPVRVYSQPSMSNTVNSLAQCLKGNDFQFTNTSSNTDGTLSYLWNYGTGTASTQNLKVSYAQAGSYNVWLKGTSSFGCRDSVLKQVTVHPQAKVQFKVNDSDQCFYAHNFVFTNSSSVSSGTLSYQWSFGDGNTSTQSQPQKNYTFPGTYTVRLISITNQQCRDTAFKPVRVYASPQVDYTVNTATQCLKGNRYQFTNASTSADGSMTYNWKFGDGINSAVMSPSYIYKTDGDVNVTLIATTSFGCKDSAVKTMTILPKAAVRFAANDSDQCFRNNSFIFANTTNISRGTINSYLWRFGDGTTSTSAAPGKVYSTYGTYAVQLEVLSNAICRDTLVKNIRVYAQPQTSFNSNPGLVSCLNYNKFQLASTSTIAEGSLLSNWSFGDGNKASGNTATHSYASAGSYNLKLLSTSNFGCTDSLTKQVTVNPSPVAVFSPARALFCEKDKVAMNNSSAISSGSLTYFWRFGNGDSAALAQPFASYTTFGKYTVLLEATSDKGCKDTALNGVEVASIPTTDFEILPPMGCAGQTRFNLVSKTVNPDGRALTHDWDFGNGITDQGVTVSRIFPNEGAYSIRLQSSSAVCSLAVSKPLQVSRTVFADFEIDSINPETMRFRALDSTWPGYQFVWKFSDGASGPGRNATHTFGDNGSYTATLIVFNDKGCSDTLTREVVIGSPNYLEQKNPFNFYVYPNPTEGKFTYKFVSDGSLIEIKLYDILGQKPLYYKVWDKPSAGMYYETVSMKDLNVSAGTYILQIVGGEKSRTVKITFTD